MKENLKKILSLALVLAIIASLAILPVSADATLTKARGDADLRFAFVADSHLSITKEGNGLAYDKLDNALDVLSNYESDLLVTGGDMILLNPTTTGNTTVSYGFRNELIEKYYPDTPKFQAVGNHEYMLFDTDPTSCAEALNNFKMMSNQSFNTHYVLNGEEWKEIASYDDTSVADTNEPNTADGYHFITFTSGQYFEKIPENTENWAIAQINSALKSDPSKPIFVLDHRPPKDTVKFSDQVASGYSQNFVNTLESSPRIIHLSAHQHTALENPTTIWQGKYTAISGGYIGGNGIADDHCDVDCLDPVSQGHIIEVDGTVVTVYRMDLIGDDLIGRPFVFDISDPSTFIYNDENYSKTAKPTFSSGITIEKIASSYVNVTVPKATCVETGENQDGLVVQYIIKAVDEDGNEVSSRNYQADYFSQTQKEIISLTANNLEAGTDYTIAVYAENPLGGLSDPLTAKVTTATSKSYKYENKNTGASLSYNAEPTLVAAIVEDAGIYSVSANLASANGNGMIKTSIVGQPYAAMLSFSGNEASVAKDVESTQYLYLDKGLNTLSLHNIGRGANDKYNNYVKWNYVTLEQHPELTKDDLVINLEAEKYVGGTPTGDQAAGYGKAVIQGSGNTLTHKINVKKAGQYKVYASAQNKSSSAASGEISCNGEIVTFTNDFAGVGSVAYSDIELGTINLIEGENEFSVKITGSTVATDYFLLKRVGEFVEKTHYELTYNTVQNLGYSSAPTEISVSVQKAGVYNVTMSIDENNAKGGIVKITSNGQVASLNYSNGDDTTCKKHLIGSLYLNKGVNKVYISNDGKGYFANYTHFDAIEFDLDVTKTKDDCLYLIEAETAAETDLISEEFNAKSISLRRAYADSATIPFVVEEDAKYMVRGYGRNTSTSTDREAICGFTFGGVVKNASLDFSGVPSTDYKTVDIGEFNFIKGVNTVKVGPETKAYTIMFDYFTVQKVGDFELQTHYENINANTGASLAHTGGATELTFNVAKTGVYAVSLNLAERSTPSRVKVTSNNQVIVYENPSGDDSFYDYANVGYFYMTKGENKVYIQNDNKSSQGATGGFHNYVKWGSVKLDYAAEKTMADCKWITEAETALETKLDENPMVISKEGNADTVGIAAGQIATIPVNVPEDGQYKIVVNGRSPWTTRDLSGYVEFGGVNTDYAVNFDGCAQTVYKDVELGTFNMCQGVNNIGVRLNAANFIFDYFMAQKVGDYTGTVSGGISQDIPSVYFAYNAEGQSFTVDVPRDGVYALNMSVCSPAGPGRFIVTANEGQIAELEFAKSSNETFTEIQNVGYFDLKQGENTIYIQNDGKAANTVYNNYVRCNKFSLTYSPDKTTTDVMYLSQAEEYTEGNERSALSNANGIAHIKTVQVKEAGWLKTTITVPKAGKYTIMYNAKRMSEAATSVGRINIGEMTKVYVANYEGVDALTYKTRKLEVLELIEGENVFYFYNDGSFLDVDYFVAKEYDEAAEKEEAEMAVVTAIGSAKTPEDVKAVMEANKDVFASYDEVVGTLFYPEALYEKFVSREFKDIDSLKNEWDTVSNEVPSVDLQIKKATDADFVGGKTQFESGASQVVVNPYKVSDGTIVIAAVYENGKLIGCDFDTANGNALTLSLGDLRIDNSKAYTFKLLYWDSLSTMVPFEKNYSAN